MIHPGSTVFGINIPGFVLHSAVHSARPDIKCVIHIHHPACIAVNTENNTFLLKYNELIIHINHNNKFVICLGGFHEMWLLTCKPGGSHIGSLQFSRLLWHLG